jgi:hypothetical protein
MGKEFPCGGGHGGTGTAGVDNGQKLNPVNFVNGSKDFRKPGGQVIRFGYTV